MAENESIVVCHHLYADLPQQELDFYQGLNKAIADDDMMQYRQQISRVFERKKRQPRSPSAPAKGCYRN